MKESHGLGEEYGERPLLRDRRADPLSHTSKAMQGLRSRQGSFSRVHAREVARSSCWNDVDTSFDAVEEARGHNGFARRAFTVGCFSFGSILEGNLSLPYTNRFRYGST